MGAAAPMNGNQADNLRKTDMVTGFAVTYERWSDRDAEIGETDDRGFVIKDVSLRDAMQLGLEYSQPDFSGFCETNEYPVRAPQWLTWNNWNDCTRDQFEHGIVESRSLHIPDKITKASRRRIARLFGAYGSDVA
jgi:hypothetical protein